MRKGAILRSDMKKRYIKNPHFHFLLILIIAAVIFFLSAGTCFLYAETKLTPEERDWLNNNRDKLIMYYDWKFPPLEFSSNNNEFTGLGADVISAVEKRLGVKFIKKVSTNWADHLKSLEEGTSVIAPVIVDTEERRGYLYFTSPYAKIPVVIIKTQGMEGAWTLEMLKGRRVAVVNEFATEEYLRKNYSGIFEIVEVNNVQEGLRDVSFGVVDAFVENIAVASYYIKKEGLSNLRVAGNTDYSFNFSIAVSRQYPLLYSALNKAFMDIPESELKVIYEKWIQLKPAGFLSREAVRIIKISGLFILLLIISLTLFSWFLKRRLNEKIVTLEKTQESLRESEALSRSILNQSFQLISLLDTEGRIVICNKKALDFVNITPAMIEGEFAWDGPWWRDREAARIFTQKAIARGIEGVVTRSETIILDASGGEHYLDFSISPVFDKNGIVVYLVAEGRDITDRKLIEFEKERLAEQLLHTRKMDAIGKLAGGVAHDFNNMLAAISGSAELLCLNLAHDPEQLKLCSNIINSVKSAAQLTKKLLVFSRKTAPMLRPVNVIPIIEETVFMLRQSIDRLISISTEHNADKTVIPGESSQIQNALLNLVINARDAMPDGGSIIIRTENISIDDPEFIPGFNLAPGIFLKISVIDSGTGIPEEIRERIFEPFFTTKDIDKGTGLGLSAVYGCIIDHKGAVSISSSMGKGSEFILYLPVTSENIVSRNESSSIIKGSGAVLLIDDEPVLRDTAAEIIRSLGYRVYTAENGNEGIRFYREHSGELSAVICDMIMPELSGADTLKKLKEIDASVPLIICSGYHMDQAGVLLEDKIADDFIHKPFTIMELSRVLSSLIKKRD